MSRSIRTKIAGVTYKNDDDSSRQELIRKYINEEDVLLLEREPGSNAIAVRFFPEDDYEGDDQIGYINSELAADLAPLMDTGSRITCQVLNVTGGTDEQPSRGVNIELVVYTPEEVAEYNRQKEAEAQSRAKEEQDSAPAALRATIESITRRPKTISRRSKKNYWILLILWLFLGIIGGHRIYAGRGSWLYSLTLGYFTIGFLIDLVVILLGQFKDNKGLLIKP